MKVTAINPNYQNNRNWAIANKQKGKYAAISEACSIGLSVTKSFTEEDSLLNKSIDFTQTKGLFKGLRAFWSFEKNGNGTRISISTKFEKPAAGFLGEWLLGKFLVERTTRKILLELRYALCKMHDLEGAT